MGWRSAAGALLGSAVSSLLGGAPDPLADVQRQRGHAIEDEDAAARARERARSRPSAGHWLACAHACARLDRFDEAVEASRQAIALDPRDAEAHRALGNALKARGEQAPAIEAYRAAVDLDPASVAAWQDLLFALLCSADASDAQVHEAHIRFAAQFEAPLRPHWPRHGHSKDPARRLRIGYVSADLRDHVAGRCIAPILAHHDRARFDVHCYFDARLADDFTKQMRKAGGTWHDMAGLDDGALSKQVRADRIDILVDLSGHTPGNRILAFASKPAPVQVSYLDYSATTGLSAIGHRLTTEALDPAGIADPFYSESLFRLPGSYWLYNPHPVPEPATAPRAPGVLFACLNSFYRVNDGMLQAWAQLLRAVPGSRLALVGVPAGSAQERVAARMAQLGVKRSRLELFGFLNHGHFLQLVRATDIALGPFPYDGAMSMLDALWHGVPTVALAGRSTFHSRMAQCVLPLVGLDSLIARDEDSYIAIAAELARDEGRRAQLRAGLRETMQRSPLCDAKALTRALEDAYRTMWRRYCEADAVT